MKAEFSTFCHISQYGDEGYLALPRIIAMGQACLWAPSSTKLRSVPSGLSTDAFLRYLAAGEIRIFARENWVHNSHWRNNYSARWPDAAWDEEIDGTIRHICEQDREKTKDEQRVVVVPTEAGDKLTRDYLNQHPDEIGRWEEVLAKRRGIIPSGTREAAERERAPKQAVSRILRDAFNHGQAVQYSGADAAIFVQDFSQDFLDILASAPPLDEAGRPQRVMLKDPDEPTALRLSRAANDLIELLEELDIHARDRDHVDSLDRFILGKGRRDLMRWMHSLCELLKDVPPEYINGFLLKELRREFGLSGFPGPVETLLHGGDEGVVTAVTFAVTAAAAASGIQPDQVGGMLAGIYPIFKGVMRQFSGAPDAFTGPQWPFLYAYGTKSRRNQFKHLKYVLDVLYQRQRRKRFRS